MTLTLSVTPAQVDVAMGKAQAAMGRFEGSLVKQSDFIQDQMPAAVEKLTALMQQCDEVMRLSLQEDPASEAKVRARARARVKG